MEEVEAAYWLVQVQLKEHEGLDTVKEDEKLIFFCVVQVKMIS